MFKKVNMIKSRLKILIVTTMLFLSLSEFFSYNVNAQTTDDVLVVESKLIQYEGNDKIVKIPKNVKEVCTFAFKDNKEIEKVILPEGLIFIDAAAFYGCSNLKEVVLPKTLKKINNNAFSACNSLRKIILPEGLSKMEELAFSHCVNLEEVTLPSTLKTIEWATFSDCYNLKKVTIKEGTESIKDSAFSRCNLSKLILPSTLKYFDGYAINGCENLKQINIPKDCTVNNWEDIIEFNGLECINVNPENKKYMSIDGVVFSKDGKTMICYPSNKKNESYTIPDSVKYINKAKFYAANHLKHLIFGVNVTCKKISDINSGNFMNGTLEDFTVPVKNKTFCDVDGVLFTKDRKTLVFYPPGKTENVYIVPKGTEELSLFTFDTSNSNLKYLVIPPSVTKIVDMGAGDDYIDEYTFVNKDTIIFGENDSAANSFANGDNYYNNKFTFRTCESNKEEQIFLTEEQVSLSPGNTLNLYAISIPSYTMANVKWHSSDNSIISINESGKAIAKNIGMTNITATAENGESIICFVTVKMPE